MASMTSDIRHPVCKTTIVPDDPFKDSLRMILKKKRKLKLQCFYINRPHATCGMVKKFSTLIRRDATGQNVKWMFVAVAGGGLNLYKDRFYVKTETENRYLPFSPVKKG